MEIARGSAPIHAFGGAVLFCILRLQRACWMGSQQATK
jgi:hypothetical protein